MPKRLIPKPMKRTCLSHEERVIIQDRLDHRTSITEISAELKRHHSTISRDIQLHSKVRKTLKNDCANKDGCKRKHICGNMKCSKVCRYSQCMCKRDCKDYVKTMCPALEKAPHVCNGCSKRAYCEREKYFYDAKEANKEADESVHERNAGFYLTGEELDAINNMVSPMIKNGNSVYHVATALKDQLSISMSTLYRLINSCELDARNIDLRFQVKLHHKAKRKMKNEQMINIRKIGKLWKDYLAYMEQHDDVSVVQMDCVEGSKSSAKVLLTLHWTDIGFQLAVLMKEQTAESVVEALDDIERAIGTEAFRELFPLILTDNGTEFTAIEDMERSCLQDGVKRTMLFFCEPNMASEKGACENNHKYIRYIIPKGTDLDQFTQADITLCMSHVNSFLRKKVDGFSPIAKAKVSFPAKFWEFTGLKEVRATEVILKPELLGLRGNGNGKYTKSN